MKQRQQQQRYTSRCGLSERQQLNTYRSGQQGAPLTKLDELNTERDPKQFKRQADHFTECILENTTPGTPGEEGLRDMRYMKEMYRAAGVNNL